MNTKLAYSIMFDDQARASANAGIDKCVTRFNAGRTDFSPAEALAFACDVLLIMGDLQDDSGGRRLVASLTNPRGVSYAAVVPLMTALSHRTNIAIDRVRTLRIAELERVSVTEPDPLF
jgi:hypothetical protein